jgi:hypothetical protein
MEAGGKAETRSIRAGMPSCFTAAKTAPAQVRGMLGRAGQLAKRDGGYALRAL